MSYVVRSRRMF